MKTHTTLLMICFFCIIEIYSTAQVRFQKSFGGGQPEYGRWLEKTADGNYIIAGSSKSYGAGNSDFILIKTDGNGDTLWVKTYGGSNLDEAYSMAPTNDSGYVIAGYTKSFGGGVEDVYLVKTDGDGNVQWSRSFGDNVLQKAVSVRQTTDNGFIIGAYNFFTDFQFLLIKTDANGDTLWTNKYGSGQSEVADQVIQTNDGGYAVIGYTVSWGAGNEDLWLLKTDASGNVQWGKTYGGNGNDYGYAVQQTSDGGYIIAGSTNSFGAGDYDVLLIKTDSGGDTLWSRTFGSVDIDHASDVIQTSDGGFLVGGKTKGFGAVGEDCYLVKTDNNGDLIWSMKYGGNGFEHISSVKQMNNGGYLFAGYTDSYGSGLGDIYYVMLNDTGQSGCNESKCNTLVSSPPLQVGQGQAAGGGVPSGSANTISKKPSVAIELMCWCDSLFPVADFTFISNGLTIDFTDASFAASSWYWTFGDAGNSFLQNPSHTYASPGAYQVCLVATNNCGQDIKCDTIGVFPPGFDEKHNAISFTAYPNPTQKEVTVMLKMNFESDITITITNPEGNVVGEFEDYSGPGSYIHKFDLLDYAAGVYFIKLVSDKGVTIRKLVLQ